MALLNASASFLVGQKVSVLMLLVVSYAMAFAGPAMANGSSKTRNTLQSHLVQALKEEGGFTAAATFLGAVDLNRVLPESSTILVPMDEDVLESGLQVSTFNTALPILQYHVITKRLAFHDLQQLPEGETLETLLPNNTVIITSNYASNFSIDDVPLSRGNLFLASSTAVHGISGVLSFATYGKMKNVPNSHSTTPPSVASPVEGGEPAKQPIPPSTGKDSGSTSKGTESSPSPANATGAVTPPVTPATQTPANASSSSESSFGPVSLPTPSGSPPKSPIDASPTTPKLQSRRPPPKSQQARPPFLPTNCDVDLVCTLSSSSSHHLKPWFFKDFIFAALLQAVLHLARVPAAPRFTLMLYVTFLLMAAAPTSGEMNTDLAEVLRNKGGFGYAAIYLQALDMHKALPNRSTVLVPTDAAIDATGLIYNTLGAALPTLKYHVVTKQLSFEDLQKLPVGTTLETLLPSSSLLITSNTASNFTVNYVLLSHPNIFCSDGTAVHGISGVMNFSHPHWPAADMGLPHLQAPPLPPHLIFPLPESAGPFATPLPISRAVTTAVNISRLILLLSFACTSCFLLIFTTLSS